MRKLFRQMVSQYDDYLRTDKFFTSLAYTVILTPVVLFALLWFLLTQADGALFIAEFVGIFLAIFLIRLWIYRPDYLKRRKTSKKDYRAEWSNDQQSER